MWLMLGPCCCRHQRASLSKPPPMWRRFAEIQISLPLFPECPPTIISACPPLPPHLPLETLRQWRSVVTDNLLAALVSVTWKKWLLFLFPSFGPSSDSTAALVRQAKSGANVLAKENLIKNNFWMQKRTEALTVEKKRKRLFCRKKHVWDVNKTYVLCDNIHSQTCTKFVF